MCSAANSPKPINEQIPNENPFHPPKTRNDKNLYLLGLTVSATPKNVFNKVKTVVPRSSHRKLV
jgi:hypothetical protein